MRSLLITGCVFALSCSASEDANDAVRCAPDRSCPGQQVCYRGFCVEGQAEDAGAPASSTAQSSGPSAPAIVVEDAGGASTGSGAADASATGVSPKPGQPAPAVTNASVPAGPANAPGPAASGPATSTMPAAPAGPASAASLPVPAEPGAASAPAPSSASSALPALLADASASSPVEACIQLCALQQKGEKACEQCFEALYGDKPHKLCSGAAKADSAALVVCAAFCAADPEGPFSCGDSRACHGAACGSD